MRNSHRTFTDVFVTWVALAGGILGTSVELGLIATAPDPSVHRINLVFGLAFTTVAAGLLILKKPNALACVAAAVLALGGAVVATGSAEVERARVWMIGLLFAIGIVMPLATTNRRAVGGFFVAAIPVAIVVTRAPGESALETVQLGAVFAFIYVVSVYQVLRILRDLRRRDAQKAASFRRAPIPTWEQDYTAVERRIRQIQAAGVDDFRAWLDAQPSRVNDLLAHAVQGTISEATYAVFECEGREEFLAPGALDIVGPGVRSAIADQLTAVANREHTLVSEIQARTFKGRVIDLEVHWAAPLVDGAPDYSSVVLAAVDLTARKDAERRLEAAASAKDVFVATVSHELRTPLTAVVGIAEELADNRGLLDQDEIDELIGLMASEGRDVSNIVDDLLVAARLESGQVTIALERCGLAETIASVISHFTVTEEIPDELSIKADPHRVRQVVRNLLSNAQRYGGGDVVVSAKTDDGMVVIDVADNGNGIPPELREAVFEPYQRAEPRPGLTASVGLGLTISRNLAELMNGSLEYHRTDGWSVFRLSLPSG